MEPRGIRKMNKNLYKNLKNPAKAFIPPIFNKLPLCATVFQQATVVMIKGMEKEIEISESYLALYRC